MSDWYYAANNEQKGPINESELKANFAANKLPADTLVWKDGMDNWTPANQVAAFTFRQPPTPAKVQPSMETSPTMKAAASPSPGNPDSTKPVDLATLVGPGEALEVDAEDAEKNKIYGILAYLWILCLVPIFAAKDSPFAKYHANQGLVLFLVEIVLSISVFIVNIVVLTIMPAMGFIGSILSLIQLGPLILLIIGIINAAAGKCVPLPVIGGIKLLK
ncbi:MAG: DUF4339 domain-containing protein [Methylacidiphilales bacterium]|nr:DUF4339 domain-containing protein [Candidatus Methylacidiphilales bacterium]